MFSQQTINNNNNKNNNKQRRKKKSLSPQHKCLSDPHVPGIQSMGPEEVRSEVQPIPSIPWPFRGHFPISMDPLAKILGFGGPNQPIDTSVVTLLKLNFKHVFVDTLDYG